MIVFVSFAEPPRTNNPSVSPICCVPGNVSNAEYKSASEPVVTISSGRRITALFSSLASNDPAEITTVPSSVDSSFNFISKYFSFLSNNIFSE